MLTDQRKRFCDEYLIHADATRAYKTAYPNIKKDATAASAGSRLLSMPEIRAYIDARLDEVASEKIADADEIMQYLTSVMRGECKEETLRSVSKGKQIIDDIDVSAKDRIKAAELLGKRHGIWTDRIDVTADVGVTIIDDLEAPDG